MSKVKILDCTLRDGGYANNWDFTQEQINSTVKNLTCAGVEYVELGYLTSIFNAVNGTLFQNVESASRFIPKDKGNTKYLIMADVGQFDADTLCRRDKDTVDGIRVVFYKRQIESAMPFCKKVVDKGYDLFIQPMVTIDYTICEYEELIRQFCELYHPCAVSVVDSFGCMMRDEILSYAEVLDGVLGKDAIIGFHGHENIQLSLINALSLFEYKTDRNFILDASVNGMGRGAGNLRTELIVHYSNIMYKSNYNLDYILRVVSEVTEPISRTVQWGYSPYFMLTALRRAHPHFATYLLEKHDVSIAEFRDYLRCIPDQMLTRCTRPYVEELYKQFMEFMDGSK